MFPPEKIRAFITENIAKELGREARLGDIQAGLFKGIVVRDFALSESPGFKNGTFIEARAFVLKLSLRPLLQKKVVIREVALDTPQITVIRNADGKTFNFSDLTAPKPGSAAPKKAGQDGEAVQPLSITVTLAEIKNGKIVFMDKSKRKMKLTLDPIDLTVKAADLTRPMSVDLQTKASGTYEGKEIRAALGLKCVVELLAARVKVEQLSLDLPELGLDAKGGVSGFAKPDLDFSFTVRNIDLRSVGRWVKISSEAAITASPSVQGSLKGGLQKLACDLDIRDLGLQYQSYRLEKIGVAAKITAAGAMIKSQGNMTVGSLADPRFEAQNVEAAWDMSDLAGGLGKMSGTVKLTTGGGRIKNIPLLSAIAPILHTDPSVLAFTRMSGNTAISDGFARTDDFQVNSPVADVYARGAVGLAKMLPDMALTAKLPKGSIGGAVGELSNDAEGRPTFVFKMKGSWKPVFDSSQVQKKALEKAKEEIKTKAADIIQNEGKKLLEGLFKR
ncbi:MAG: hypothetical protein A3A86_01100 [Elusimicrobia bacterium RIFCSPLOWO2_01_FULL_60_11]|nr:MAG: hypothetical protein A3A86_01100 [Elusimicrobia bacterium RIFCSPLOWO2_01_FULL_60_11]